jgi:hypothetical protein
MSPPTNSAQRHTQSRRYALLRQMASVNAPVGRNVSGSAGSYQMRFAILCWTTKGCETRFVGQCSTANRPSRPTAQQWHQAEGASARAMDGKVRCSRSQIPALCQSRRRRQQVMPLPQPISRGSCSHGMPVESTNRVPVSTARLGMRGRPPVGLGPSAGKRGSITVQSSSPTSSSPCLNLIKAWDFVRDP